MHNTNSSYQFIIISSMQLLNFQVSNYRSINDSGLIDVNPRTMLVGRNESGKTNLLLALQSLNPPAGIKKLSYVKDFPRWRNISAYQDSLIVVKTRWALSTAEQQQLLEIFPRTGFGAEPVTELVISRDYTTKRQIHFVNLPPLEIDSAASDRQRRSIERSIKNALKDALDKRSIEKAGRALNVLSHEIATGQDDPAEWALRVLKVIGVFQRSFDSLKLSLPDSSKTQLQALSKHAEQIAADAPQQKQARIWVSTNLPVFVYLNEYPKLAGHQNLKVFLQHAEQSRMSEAEQNFARLCKVAELEPAKLLKSLHSDHQQRQLLTNRASAIVTRKLRKLWRDRPLKVRFHADAEHFDTLISEPDDVYDVEVNLDERSRGFRWFFSFYITFAADTTEGLASNAIVLLDEPGMHLHAHAQRDLLDHFIHDFDLPVLFTTHSPFMIPQEEVSSVRTVDIDPEHGTWVSNQPQARPAHLKHDSRTLFPLQAALAYEQINALFAQRPCLLVPSLAEAIMLEAIYVYLQEQGKRLPALDIIPGAGTHKIAHMAALLGVQAAQLRILETHKMDLAPDHVALPAKAKNIAALLPDELLHEWVCQAHKQLPGEPPPLLYKETSADGYLDALTPYVRFYHEREQVFQHLQLAKIFMLVLGQNPQQVLSETNIQLFEKFFHIVI
ncbi:AAA family ATPase [Candidatus Venteria ishoeyi]|uniref:AAA family ATPase n=1 Tax=Candidatus Venteria ishoeyi TaxID=1899563 RepID=UPI0025A5825F|nr:AAA family ATPase [Candidatus Venteria ishoeyi]MDM8545184.1 AAA family ATPase [Candidatus Venteria ishoeyi]